MSALLLAQMLMMGAQLLVLSGALINRQGLAYWWLVPFFTLAYGPVLLAVRFAGTWKGLRDIGILRRKEVELEHAVLGAPLADAALIVVRSPGLIHPLTRRSTSLEVDRGSGLAVGPSREMCRRSA